MKTKVYHIIICIICAASMNASAFTVTLSASQTGTLCQYTSVDFSANIVDPSSYSKTAVWIVDGVQVFTFGPHTNNAAFVYPNPGAFTYGFSTSGTHQVWCEVSSPAYNSGNPVFSDTLTYQITQNEAPQVTIVDLANGNPICVGTLDLFVATSIDAGNPTYTWFVDGVPDASSTTATLNYIALTAGVHMVHCVVHSNQACDAVPPVNNPDAISLNTVIVNVDPCGISMPQTGSQIVNMCGGIFYDSGGQLGNYSSNENGVLTICPSVPGQSVSVTFTSFSTEVSMDILTIYNGMGIGSPVLSPSPLSGTSASLPLFISTDLSGCLTFRFISNANTIDAGWSASISCFPLITSQLYVTGRVYFDVNSNGTFEMNEPLLNNQQVSLTPPSTTLLVWSNGGYAYPADSGDTYQITMNPPAGWQITSSPLTYNVPVTTNSIYGLDFGMNSLSPLPPDVSIAMTSQLPRCNTNRVFALHLSNAGTIPASGVVTMVYDTSMIYVGAAPVPDTIIGNVIIWNYTNLLLTQPQNINVVFTMPGPFITIVNSATISALDTLSQIIDTSSCTNSQLVLCSYDPNDKTVSPYTDNAPNNTLMNSWLSYRIRFQNTGNAPASEVEVIDTLSSLLDLSTLEIISASHPMFTFIEGGNILHFLFPNINLPDSNANEPASHGYINYRIKPNSGLPDPSVIQNTAYIYFDFNPAVQTNTTINTMTNNIISVPENSSNGGQSILFIPNPATNQITLHSGKIKIESIEVFDMLGQRVYLVHNPSLTINVSQWHEGIYFVRLKSDGQVFTEKVVISR